jgi:hypothetical protein
MLQFGFVILEEHLRPRLAIGAPAKRLDSRGPMPLYIDDGNGLVREDACDFQARFEVFQGGHARLSPWGNKGKRMAFVICAAHLHPLWSLLDETPEMFSIRPFLCRVNLQIYRQIYRLCAWGN